MEFDDDAMIYEGNGMTGHEDDDAVEEGDEEDQEDDKDVQIDESE